MSRRFFIASFLAFLLAFTIPAWAQSLTVAPIIVDGRTIFTVSQSERVSADERAKDANQLLKEVIQSHKTIQVEVDNTRQIPVILVNGSHLLSVTANDTPIGRSPQEQSIIWRNQLQQALDQSAQQRTADYLTKAILISLGVLFLSFLINQLLSKLWGRWVHNWFVQQIGYPSVPAPATTPSHSQIPGQFTRLSQPPRLSPRLLSQTLLSFLKSLVWFVGIIYITGLYPQTRQLSYDLVRLLFNSLVSDIFTLGQQRYSVLDLMLLMALFVVLVYVAQTIAVVLRSQVLSITGLSIAAQDTIALIANYAIVFIGIIILLQLWGLDLSSLTVFAGVLGVGIGLGLQGIAKEFVSGLVLIFERPIRVGDFVEVANLMGTVEKISVRSTIIKTLDDISVILPNSRFLESEVINWSHGSTISRLKLPVGVAYGTDMGLVKTSLLESAKQHKEILNNPSPRVLFLGFGADSLDFVLLVWIAKPHKQFQIKSDLYFIIESTFRKRNIEVPFNQVDLNFRSGNLPIGVSPELVNSLSELSKALADWLKYNSQSK